MASVFDELESAVAALERVGAGLEPDCFDVGQAKRAIDLCTRAERLVVASRNRLARRVERAVVWKRDGHRSAAHWLASATGTSVGSAMRSLETARRLEELPETADAFRAGELSESQASEIAAAAIADPSAEGRLLDQVRDGKSFREFRDQCREAKLRAADDRAMAQRLHETRSVRTWSDGHWCLEARLRPDEGARVNQVLEHKTNELFEAARAEGRSESREAYRADALAAIMRGELPEKPIELRLEGDYAALGRGYLEPGERLDLDGIPIPVTIARALLGDAKLVLLAREGHEITKISSPKRGIPIVLRRWVERAYPCGGVGGCGQDKRLQIDHIVPVEAHGPTCKENLWRLALLAPPHVEDVVRLEGRHRRTRHPSSRPTRRR